MAPGQSNPYVGPRTFQEEDSRFFFGRDREARELLSKVIAEPLVMFYSESGAGKSSLINARLIPGLREEEFHVLPVVRVGGALPVEIEDVDNIFIFNLLLGLCEQGDAAGELTSKSIPDFLKEHRLKKEAADQAWVLIIDQFEEILNTHLERWQERELFFKQLGQAMREDPLLWVVLTMREDYVAALRPFMRLVPGQMRARFYMQRMKVQAGLEAVEKPAAHANRPFAAGVAQILVDNLRQIRGEDGQTHLGEFVEPVQLQVVCYQIWDNLQDSEQTEITQSDLEQMGDVDTALAQYYEHAISNVLSQTSTSELTLRNWFDQQLITEAETRGTVYQGQDSTAGLGNDAVRSLADQYLLRSEVRAGGTWYELVHDRFVTPILQANAEWRMQQNPVVLAAEKWHDSGRNPQELLDGSQLRQALETVNRDTAEPMVKSYLDASEGAQQRRELARRRQRRLTIALAIVFVLALAAAIFALGQRNEAQTNAHLAETRQQEAQSNAQLAETRQQEAQSNAQLAETRKQEAVVNAELAESNRQEADAERSTAVFLAALAASSEAEAVYARQAAERNAAEVAARGTKVGELLALTNLQSTSQANLVATIAASNASDSVAATANAEAFTRATADSQTFATAAAAVEEGLDISGRPLAFGPDGFSFVSAGEDRTLRLWDVINAETPILVGKFPPHGGEILDAAIGPEGQILASAGMDGVVYLWDVSEPESPSPVVDLTVHSNPVFAVRFLDGNRPALVSGSSEAIFFWDASQEIQVPQTFISSSRNSFINTLAIRPDGRLLATAMEDNSIRLWNPANAANPLVSELTGHSNPVQTLAYSGDGNILASAGDGRAILYWNLDGRGNIGRSALGSGEHTVLAFSFHEDGEFLTTAEDDGFLRDWDISDLDKPALLFERGFHQGPVNSAIFSSDGLTLAYSDEKGTIIVDRLVDSPVQMTVQ